MSHRRALSQLYQISPSQLEEHGIPEALANNIIEKEIELDNNATSAVIHELIALYSKAIEHCEQQNNPKYLDFQERMHKMLIKPQVLAILKLKNCKNANPEPSPIIITDENAVDTEDIPLPGSDELSLRKYQAELTRKELSAQLNASLFKQKSQKNVNIAIERHSTYSKETAHRAVNDFKSQDSALNNRLASRKQRNFTRSLSYGIIDFEGLNSSTCDLSDLYEENNTSTKSNLFVIEEQIKNNYAMFEHRLEEIMEQNYGERALKIAEIKLKYESQINEFTGMGEVMDMLVEQMKKNMKEEIDKIIEEHLIKRKESVQKLKEELFISG